MLSFLIHLHLMHSHARQALFEVLWIFFPSLNWEVMLWQQETESKGWKDQVEFETWNLRHLNRFPIWKLTFSHARVFMMQTHKEAQHIVSCSISLFYHMADSNFLFLRSHLYKRRSRLIFFLQTLTMLSLSNISLRSILANL